MRRFGLKDLAGFTIIEFVVTAATLAVLASLSVGFILEYRDRTYIVEVELLAHDFRNAAFVLMNSMPLDDGTNPTCRFQYDINNGYIDLGCASLTGDNTYLDLFQLDEKPIYVFGEYISDDAVEPAGWSTAAYLYHCKVKEQNNTLNAGFNSNNSVNFAIWSFENPASAFSLSVCP